jgi:tetracycline resistance efflux pump
MEGTILSLLPPVITIALTIITRRILLSLGVGIIFGALMASNWSLMATVTSIFDIALSVLGEGNIFLFVLLIGALNTLIYISGGVHAFAEWAIQKVRTPFQAKLATIFLGFLCFFDDAFSCLFRGSLVRPITDKHRISRSKLAYMLHSTSAPVIIMLPISAWAGFIAALIGTILIDNGITQYAPFEAYLLTIPTNYYAMTTILLVIAVAYFKLNIGQMKRDENRATEEGILFDTTRGAVAGQEESTLPVRADGKLKDLLLPVFTLVTLAIIISAYIGISNIEGQVTPLQILMNTDVIKALVYSAIAAVIVAIIRLLGRKTPVSELTKAVGSGMKAVLPSVTILFMALMTAQIISKLGVGLYLASLIDENMSLAWLPVIFFLISAFMSFSMGSTFGTFGLMLPIGAEIVSIIDVTYLIPVFGAVLAGCIFGEHSSPLSDTTILASIGGGVHTIDHLLTQMPYALISSFVSIVGYVTLGFTKNIYIGLFATLLALGIVIYVLVKTKDKSFKSGSAELELEKA